MHFSVDYLDDALLADGRCRPRLGEEAGDHVVVLGQLGEQHLDGGVAPDVPVAGEVNFAHPTGAETPDDVVGPNLRADFKHPVLLRGYSLSSLPTSDRVKEAPMYLKCGCTCSPDRYQPGR